MLEGKFDVRALDPSEKILIENNYMSAHFDSETSLLTSVVNKADGKENKVQTLFELCIAVVMLLNIMKNTQVLRSNIAIFLKFSS